MKVETLHAPHGREIDGYRCPKCSQEFEALFQFNKHIREAHQEQKGSSK